MAQFYKDQRLKHMSQMEAFLWVKFLEANGNDFFNYEYDVYIRKPVNVPREYEAEYKAMAISLSSLRIDATMQDKNNIYIVEIRPGATHSAIGQLIMYRFLYLLQFNPIKPVKMMLISDKYDPAIEITARAIDTKYIIY
jgi:hypothetical protein